MKKKILIISIISVLILGILIFVFFRFIKGNESTVGNGKITYVESVGLLSGKSIGVESRYMGVVESQETTSVTKDSNKTIKEIYVKEGDSVKKGDELFSYDTTDMELDLEQLNLDRTGIQNTIDSYYTSINDYKTQRDNATSEDDILSYTSQINNISTSIKEQEYNLSVKDMEISKQQESINNATITAPMDGVIKKINDTETSGFDMNEGSGEDANAFITIIADGDYRIKGTADESNIKFFTAGTPVLLRSRVDESIIWKGTVTKVDLEPVNENNGYFYQSGNGESASNYNFYINPEDTTDLILGQHLYVEYDRGQTDVKSGIYLPSYYLIAEGEDYYVYRQDADGRIEKTKILVGDYDENLDVFEIVDGLKTTDYIAFPNDDVAVGNKCTTNYQDVLDQESDDVISDDPQDEIRTDDMEDSGDIDDMDIIEEPGDTSDGDVIISDDGPGGFDGSPDTDSSSDTYISDDGPQ